MSSSVPQWFNATAYYANKLAQLGSGWTSDQLDRALFESGYSLDSAGLFSHYNDFGKWERVSPTYFFDDNQYLTNLAKYTFGGVPTQYQVDMLRTQLNSQGITGWDHFMTTGWKNFINPSSSFDTLQYMRDKLGEVGGSWNMQQLIAAFERDGLDPITHYLHYGRNEGLYPKPPAGAFSAELSPGADFILDLDSDDPTFGELNDITDLLAEADNEAFAQLLVQLSENTQSAQLMKAGDQSSVENVPATQVSDSGTETPVEVTLVGTNVNDVPLGIDPINTA